MLNKRFVMTGHGTRAQSAGARRFPDTGSSNNRGGMVRVLLAPGQGMPVQKQVIGLNGLLNAGKKINYTPGT
jgi:hypothetical protein